jgi:membrane fusion protein (multidrug efflux system)
LRYTLSACQDYDNAAAKLQQDEADVMAAEAAVRTATINLAYTKVYSPISGRTGRSMITEGALVTANQASYSRSKQGAGEINARGRQPV